MPARADARFLRGAGFVLAAAIALPSPVRAQDDGSPIIVTARRQDERPSEVPLTIEAIPAERIVAGEVENLQSLSARVPALSFEAAWGGFNSFPVLRGQSQPSIAGDNVGMFVDGVYQASRDALDVDPLDLQRIEVVEGPQSALFGHSTFAGLIHYVPAEPTDAVFAMASADVGTDGGLGATGIVSGPINTTFKGRAALFWKRAQGTWRNGAEPDQHLGSATRVAAAASFATRDGGGPLSARLSARYGSNRANQPPFFTLDYRTYNCGSRDAASGAWSYFCDKPAIPNAVAVSPGLPDSRSRTGQLALHLALALPAIELRSDSSLYLAGSHAMRDLDGSAEGDLYGVCLQGVNCAGIGSLVTPLLRLQRVNIVLQRSLWSRELTQEFRVRSTHSAPISWQLGAAAFWSRLRPTLAFGAERGALAGSERLSSPVLSNLQRVGPPAAINAALVTDPNATQIIFSDSIERRRTLALFATADLSVSGSVRLRGELRSTWERLELDSRTSSFVSSFGTALGAREFHDLTPRVSADWRPANGWLAYASYAKGSRSGGINPVLGLIPAEQTYAPESNWTAEAGLKYSGRGFVRSAQLAAYDIDWRNAQIQGIAASPGVTALIIRNTRGIRTRGIEAAAEVAPARWLALDVSWSYTNPRFKRGSEGPGDGAACGLAAGVTTSSFCMIVPSTVAPGQLVPDLSGNLVARVPQTTWFAAVRLTPSWHTLRGLRLEADASHQDDVFDRQIDGLSYGARTLLGARVFLPLGAIVLELWGTNLTDFRYARVAAPRQPVFYNSIPRPTDLILGDGRRAGLTLRYSG